LVLQDVMRWWFALGVNVEAAPLEKGGGPGLQERHFAHWGGGVITSTLGKTNLKEHGWGGGGKRGRGVVKVGKSGYKKIEKWRQGERNGRERGESQVAVLGRSGGTAF